MSESVRFTITLPETVARSLDNDVSATGMSRSALIAHYIAEHYERAASPDLEEQIIKLKRQHEDELTYTRQEYERQVKKLHDDLQLCKDAAWELQQNQIGEIEQLRVECEAKCNERCAELQRHIAERETSIDELEKTRRTMETNNLNLMAKLRAQGENHERALTEQEHRHSDVLVEEERRCEKVTSAMRHELERAQDATTRLEEHVIELKGQIHDLKEDKRTLHRQLELVTLRLPAPKEGIVSRLFGRRRKEQEAKT